jgi:uncharacterized short protein YbdD (DUF466 family)
MMPAGPPLAALWRKLVQAARLAIGVPDYDTYVTHMRAHHPQARVMDYPEFFAERQQRRYGNGRTGCC